MAIINRVLEGAWGEAAMPAFIRAFLWRVLHFGRRKESENTLDTELQFHLQMEMEENLRQGMSYEEARRQALISLVGFEQTREACREARTIRWLDEFRQDAGYGIRTMALFESNCTLSGMHMLLHAAW